jgi:hypothetical protein
MEYNLSLHFILLRTEYYFFNSWLVFVQQGFSRTSTLFLSFRFQKRYYSWFIRFHNFIYQTF